MTSLDAATRELLERLRPETVPDGIEGPVVAPSSPAEAAEVLRVASETSLRVGFLGGGTQLGIGGPFRPDIWLSSSSMSRIVDHQPEDLTLVVQAGVPVADIEALLDEYRQSAMLPEVAPRATIGGVLATGTSGYRRLRYGPTRDRVLEVTLATGYGEVVRAGGRVVKNVTGYDLARLCVGSLGSLGFIGEVCLKLWPLPQAAATVAVDDPVAALAATYRPLAVLETEDGAAVYLLGTPEQVTAQAGALGGRVVDGHHWPEPVRGRVRCSMRVAPRHVPEAVRTLRGVLPAAAFRAQHGVGEITFGGDGVGTEPVEVLRRWTESRGGSLVVLEAPAELGLDPWGTPPAFVELQRRVTAAFDPQGICNPGRLPGGR